MKPIWYLEDVNLFQVLCPHKFKQYKASHRFDQYRKKDYIYFEADHANKVYLIEKGKVKIGYYTEEGEEMVTTTDDDDDDDEPGRIFVPPMQEEEEEKEE